MNNERNAGYPKNVVDTTLGKATDWNQSYHCCTKTKVAGGNTSKPDRADY